MTISLLVLELSTEQFMMSAAVTVEHYC